MCHTLPRIGYKIPYNKRVESGDSEEGDTVDSVRCILVPPLKAEIRPSS